MRYSKHSSSTEYICHCPRTYAMSRRSNASKICICMNVCVLQCGVTVYDYSHIGREACQCTHKVLMQQFSAVCCRQRQMLQNCLKRVKLGIWCAGHARVYISFDLLYRFLQYLGYKVGHAWRILSSTPCVCSNDLRSDLPTGELHEKFYRHRYEYKNCLFATLNACFISSFLLY